MCAVVSSQAVVVNSLGTVIFTATHFILTVRCILNKHLKYFKIVHGVLWGNSIAAVSIRLSSYGVHPN